MDKLLRKQYKDWFEENENNVIPELTTEQLFKLKAIYDFSITEKDGRDMLQDYLKITSNLI